MCIQVYRYVIKQWKLRGNWREDWKYPKGGFVPEDLLRIAAISGAAGLVGEDYQGDDGWERTGLMLVTDKPPFAPEIAARRARHLRAGAITN